jgi:two-component system, OmpR family, sensor kinase
MSLRLRVTLLNVLVLVLVAGAFGAVVYATQARSLESALNASLKDQAREFSNSALIGWDVARRRPAVAVPNVNVFASAAYFVQVTDRGGDVFARSFNLGDASLPADAAMVQRALRGEDWFEDVEIDGQPLRIYAAPLRVNVPPEGTLDAGLIQVARPLASMYSSLHALQATMLGVGAAGVLVSLLLGWLLARAALNPIHRLASTAHAIGSTQDLHRRVPQRSRGNRDEVDGLAREFNEMLARLQTTSEQVAAALAAQRRFVADASHELRTPLTSLRGNVDLLRRLLIGARPLAGPTQEEQILADMGAETDRMGRLVADLLLLAQADAGHHLALAPVELAPVVHDAFRGARFLREDVELRLGDVAAGRWALAHPDRLKQVVLVLLDNALKYTPAGGIVTLEALELQRGGQSGTAIRVADTGPGIPETERARIFDRFYRADTARGGDGAGLGLAIASWIVSEHHGVIEVTSGVSGGAVFTVWLPASEPPMRPTPDPAPASARSQVAQPVLS